MSEIVERILTAIDKGQAIVRPCARREVEEIRVAMNSGESVGQRMNVLTMSHKITLATPKPAKAKNQPQPKMRGRR